MTSSSVYERFIAWRIRQEKEFLLWCYYQLLYTFWRHYAHTYVITTDVIDNFDLSKRHEGVYKELRVFTHMCLSRLNYIYSRGENCLEYITYTSVTKKTFGLVLWSIRLLRNCSRVEVTKYHRGLRRNYEIY